MPDTDSLSDTSSLTVLYVDDDPVLRYFGKFFLEHNGEFTVDAVSSAEEVLKSPHLPYDIIIAGYRIKDMDGVELLKAIRLKFGEIPFILLLGPEDEGIVIDAINNGADFYLHKNCEPEERFLDLSHKIRQAIRQVERRKETEQLLQDSEKYIADIIDFLPDATFAIDHAGHVIAWNRAIEEMTGIASRDIMGKGNYEYAIPFYGTHRPILVDLIDEPDETIAQFYSTRYRTYNSLVAETDLSHPKGNKISALVKVCRLYNKAGDYIGAIESIRDITELKKTEQELRKSEERFRGMAERSSDLILILNNELSPTYVSPSSWPILGFKPEELVGKPMEFALETIFLQSGPDLMNAVQATMRREVIDDVEIRVNKKDGTPIFVNLYAVPIIQDDSITGVQVSMRDITERKKTEAANQAMMMSMVGTTGYNSLRTITKAITSWLGADAVMIGVIQPDRKMMRVLSIRLDGQEIPDFSYPVRGTPCEQVMENGFQIYRDNVSTSFPECKTLADLQIRGYIGTPLRNSDGKVFGTLCVLFRNPIDASVQVQNILEIIAVKAAADIELSQIEQTLREHQRMLAEAMNLANLVNWEYDVRADQFTFNDRFYAMYGTTALREGGYSMSSERYAREFVHPAETDLVAQEVAKAISATDPYFVFQREHRIIRRDGEIRYIMVRFGITKDDEGRTITTHGANQDITDRKKTELALRQANRQLNLLSSITRHDILNMTTVILMYLDKMEMDCSDTKLCKDLQTIQAATKMIQNQIEFTRVYEDLGVHDPIWQFLPDMCSAIHPPDSIVMSCSLDGILIFADPMLEKVFHNMLDNSIRHGEHVTGIRISSHQAGSDLILVWEDNGVGIPVEEKEKIFNRGFGKNTGLGMFLVREILSLTDITIRETGEPEIGVRFEMTIPKEGWRMK